MSYSLTGIKLIKSLQITVLQGSTTPPQLAAAGVATSGEDDGPPHVLLSLVHDAVPALVTPTAVKTSQTTTQVFGNSWSEIMGKATFPVNKPLLNSEITLGGSTFCNLKPASASTHS